VPVGPPFVSHPVDATHVADPNPGWYMGDLHMHAYHSNPHGPDEVALVKYARPAGLDFLPITEYVTNQHHRELGAAQAANPDLLIWPSREVITYYGHAIVLGETPDEVDWRHGAPGVTLRGIEERSVADGALFGIAHPTTWPGPLLSSFCRGCEFTLSKSIDWDHVTTIEVSNSATLVDDTEFGGPGLGVKIQNPFMNTAITFWQGLLKAGHKVTGVAGSGEPARQCMEMILASGVAHECRTTLHPALLAEAEVEDLAASLAEAGVRNYALQMFRAQGCGNRELVAGAASGHLNPVARQRIAARFDKFTLRLP
jgi:hypothetical protein